MTRYNYVDYAKALCIIIVVFIHTGFSALNNIILFAMPLFFMATGYTFSLGKRSARESIAIRFKTIMVPYFLLMLFYTLLEMLRATLFEYGNASIAFPSILNTVYGSGVVPFDNGIFEELKVIMSFKAQPQTGVDLILPTNCHLWFLPAMFSAYTIFVLTVNATRRNHLIKILTVCCLLLVAASEVVFTQLWQLPFGLGRGALGAAFMLFGFWIKDYKALENKSKLYFVATNLLAAVIFVGALLSGSNGSAFVRSVYGPYGALSVFISFIGGAAGIWLLLSLCIGIENLPLQKLKSFLSFIGKSAMTVYAWHMAVKFIFDAFYLCVIKKSDFSLLDEYNMGLMPQSSTWFMIFEAVSVIAICLLLSKLKQIIISKKQKA